MISDWTAISDETTGITLTDPSGNVIWVGKHEDSISFTVYADEDKARRRLRDIFRATSEAGAGEHPMCLARVRIIVEKISEPITPKLRREW